MLKISGWWSVEGLGSRFSDRMDYGHEISGIRGLYFVVFRRLGFRS
jgi:hypothetical protein